MSHQKGKDVSAGPAAETVEDLLFMIDAAGGGFFGMKGAESEKVPARLFEHHGFGNNVYDVRRRSDFSNFLFRNVAGQKRAPPCRIDDLMVCQERGLTGMRADERPANASKPWLFGQTAHGSDPKKTRQINL
jgi:hypothetical protein